MIAGVTVGKAADIGAKDSMNMGAAMAPAAADLIEAHLKDFSADPAEYDAIITGDLGSVGREILLDLLRERGYDLAKVHRDCGMEIFDSETQNTCAGGSGVSRADCTIASGPQAVRLSSMVSVIKSVRIC